MKIIDVDKIVDKIMDSPKKNLFIHSKPTSSIWWAFLVIPILYLLFRYADSFSANQTTIVGAVASTAIALLVLFITLNNEKRSDFLSAKKSAKILSEILGSIYKQIEQINSGLMHPINYPENWLEYYAKCSIYLKYDYLQYLLQEFEITKKINHCIINKNEAELANLLKYRNISITDWTFDFEIITVKHNLLCFASGYKETKPWKQEKQYVEFKDFFLENYSVKVKELTVAYLNEHNGSCDANDAEQYVLAELKKEAALNSGKYKFVAVKNKAMLSVIFKVYLSLNADDRFKLCWGELSLKD